MPCKRRQATHKGILLTSNTESTTIRVTYHDTDKMGHAYYARYLVWFEIGRTEWLRSRGKTYRELEERGVYLPVRDCTVRYHAPAYYDDLIIVHTVLSEQRRASLAFAYRIENSADGKLIAEGMTLHPFVNAERKIIKVDPAVFGELE